MENVTCPNCGFQFPLDKTRSFCFCLKCGTKIEVPEQEEKQPEVQEEKQTEVKNETPKSEPKSKIESALEEAEFYYDTSFNKKEYADTENQPTYYLKAQDLLIDLSTEFESDWRIWWEVSKPIDYRCTEFTDECRPYTINDMYFQRAVDYAPIEKKKEIIKLSDEYKERKEKYFKMLEEQEERRKSEEQKKKEKEEAEEKERLAKEKAEKEETEKKRAEEERKRKEQEEQQKREEEIKRKEQEEQQKREEEQQKEEGMKKIAAMNPQLYSELANKNYEKIDGGYFFANNADGEKVIVALRVISKMMYLIGFREASNNNALYCEQSITVKFNEQGDIVDFGNRPVMFLPDNSKLNISYIYTGDLNVNNYKLDINVEYVDQLMKKSKKAFIKSKIFR